MLNFIRAHYIIAVLVISFFAVGVVVGYYIKPDPAPQVEYKDRVVEKIVEKRVEVAVAAEAQTKIVYLDRVIKPDGTRIEHEVDKTDTNTTTTVKDMTDKVEAREEKVDVAIKPTILPQWRAGALVGIDLTLTPAYGAIAERRIVGPFSVGVWALSKGPTAGVAVTMEW